jgi:hypothetical protein
MPVLTISLHEFTKRYINHNQAQAIFESKERIVATLSNGVIIQAFKKSADKLTKESIPLSAIGYPTIGTAKLDRFDNDLAQEIRDDFNSLTEEEQAKIIKELQENTEATA